MLGLVAHQPRADHHRAHQLTPGAPAQEVPIGPCPELLHERGRGIQAGPAARAEGHATSPNWLITWSRIGLYLIELSRSHSRRNSAAPPNFSRSIGSSMQAFRAGSRKVQIGSCPASTRSICSKYSLRNMITPRSE